MNQATKKLSFGIMPTKISAALSAAFAGFAPASAEEITASDVAMNDLDEAVDEIISKAKEETSASNDDSSSAPALEAIAKQVPDQALLATLVEFSQVKNKQGRYRMLSNKFRNFIHDSMDTRIVERNMIDVPGDNEETKAARLRLAVQPLELFYQYFQDFAEITQDDITASDSGLTFQEYQAFFLDFSARRNAYVAKQEAEAAAQKAIHLAAFDSGVVTFDDLFIGLRQAATTRETYMFRNGDQNIAGKLIQVRMEQSPMSGPYIRLYIEMYSHNEEGLNRYSHSIIIDGFNETETLKGLEISKVDMTSDVSKSLIARGEKYLGLVQKPNYVKSVGNMTRKVGRTVEVINAQGRVMVDLEGMTNMDTNYHQYFCKADEGSPTFQCKVISEVSDEIKLACVPYVYGFSFKAKRWGQLNVRDLDPIEFRTDAYEMLVLDQKTKDLIFASVTDNSSDNDIIAGKGGGSINLLEGPPGVGKTLTAEAVAEKLKKPLYMVSAGELGTDVNELEDSLKDILEIAASWGAVLLIDEADIFLETRDKHDVKRNAMVAVFLRLLEYYQGVMFLTTNRADNLDPAFESRITLCIHYTDLAVAARKQIWTNLLKAAKLIGLFDLDRLAAHVLNGRQIKGVIKSAGSLARFRNTSVEIGHFEEVIAQKADFKAATVFKLGHGLDNHSEEATVTPAVIDKKPGLLQRVWNAVLNIGPSMGQGQ